MPSASHGRPPRATLGSRLALRAASFSRDVRATPGARCGHALMPRLGRARRLIRPAYLASLGPRPALDAADAPRSARATPSAQRG
eukprot:1411422-Alexandrium_andersonii.AAC.1